MPRNVVWSELVRTFCNHIGHTRTVFLRDQLVCASLGQIRLRRAYHIKDKNTRHGSSVNELSVLSLTLLDDHIDHTNVCQLDVSDQYGWWDSFFFSARNGQYWQEYVTLSCTDSKCSNNSFLDPKASSQLQHFCRNLYIRITPQNQIACDKEILQSEKEVSCWAYSITIISYYL